MQVEVDVKCMETNFGRHSFSDFGDFTPYLLPSKTANLPFPTMDYSPWSSKNLIDRNWLKKYIQVRIDELCICTNFGGRGLFSFGDTTTFKNGQFSLSDHGL